MSDEQGYNGWSNYETWCCNLWLSNDQGTYEQVNDMMRENIGASVHEVSETLREYVEELNESTADIPASSMLADMVGAFMGAVDWYEIVESWVTDMDDVGIDDHELIDPETYGKEDGYKACDSCAQVLVNGDTSGIDDETAATIAASEEAISPVTHLGTGKDEGYFDCFFCNETSIGAPEVFEGTEK